MVDTSPWTRRILDVGVARSKESGVDGGVKVIGFTASSATETQTLNNEYTC